MKPKKHLGQNFLINKTIANKIVNAVNLQNKVVLEIGPGKGALSLCLIEKAQEVYAFEIDKSLKQYLDAVSYTHLDVYKRQQEMFQNLSHDFKTPITVIKSYAEAIEDGRCV